MTTDTPTKGGVQVNNDQRLYVIPAGRGGYSTHGFDVVRKHAQQIAEILRDPTLALTPEQVGTVEGYHKYRRAVQAYARSAATSQTYYDPDTQPGVKRVFEALLQTGRNKRVRLIQGNPETGVPWLSEWEVVGTIGRSMGPLRVPILLTSSSSSGGGAILTACVLAIIQVADRQWLYRHPKLVLPKLQHRQATAPQDSPHLTHEVLDETGQIQARFDSASKAQRWIDFMRGDIPVL